MVDAIYSFWHNPITIHHMSCPYPRRNYLNCLHRKVGDGDGVGVGDGPGAGELPKHEQEHFLGEPPFQQSLLKLFTQ